MTGSRTAMSWSVAKRARDTAMTAMDIWKKVKTMNDLISRADAIEAVCDVVMDEFNTSATCGYDVAEKALEALPSEGGDAEMNEVKSPYMQPSPNGADLISRADAIEAVRKELVCDGRHEIHDKTCRFIADVLLSALPSADAVEYESTVTLNSPISISAEAVQGWRTDKPTKGGKYIVTLIGIGGYRFVSIMHYDKPFMPNKDVRGACWYRDYDEWGDVVYDDKDILAWMPLPKPYREDGEE